MKYKSGMNQVVVSKYSEQWVCREYLWKLELAGLTLKGFTEF